MKSYKPIASILYRKKISTGFGMNLSFSHVYSSMQQLDDYLNGLNEVEHYFLMDENIIAGWAITFIRDHEKWFAIIVDKAFQGKGLGTVILDQLKEHNSELNGWVVNEERYFKMDGTIYKAPLEFYLKNDFTLMENIRLDMPQMKAVKVCWSR